MNWPDSCHGLPCTDQTVSYMYGDLRNHLSMTSVYSYLHTPKGCVDGENLILHSGRSVDECKTLCNDYGDACKGFEFGVDYGGGGKYKSGDCQLQSSADQSSPNPPPKGREGKCDGSYHNLDFYTKYPGASTDAVKACQEQCQAHPQCGLFVYKSSTKQCWIKAPLGESAGSINGATQQVPQAI